MAKDVVHEGVHTYTPENYMKPTSQPVLDKLEWFQDQKLGIMIDYGPNTQLGCGHSWPLVDSCHSWANFDMDWAEDSDTFKKEYINLYKTFNPLRLDPDKWAEEAERDGFRYLVFTTKHHDGFCMYDTRYTEYKVTSPKCPYHRNRNADITRAVFEAFRRRGLGIGAYFSKADWNHPDYWNNAGIGYETTFMHSYDTSADSERWERFVRFTHNQIKELADGYGPLDILWFDAGWVSADNGENLRMEELISVIREKHPEVLSVDRAQGNACEDYLTPEKIIPESVLTAPWECCLPQGTHFYYVYDDILKPSEKLLSVLIEAVAKGGNLLLNVSPQPDGRLPANSIKNMREMGEWLRINGEAIYDTRVCAPYIAGNASFTQSKDGEKVYLIWQYSDASVPARIFVPFVSERRLRHVTHIAGRCYIPFDEQSNGITINLKPELFTRSDFADSFRFEF